MNSTTCFLVFLAISGCAFAKSVFHDGLDIIRKQNPSGCNSNVQLECSNEVAQIDQSQFDLSTPQGNRDYQEEFLAVICRPDCFSANIEVQVCLGLDEDEATAAAQLNCAERDGEFCSLRYYDGIISGDIPQIFSCNNVGESCTSECRDELTSTSSYLECCAAIFADAAVFIPNRETFERCDVTLDDPCPVTSTDQDSGASYATPMLFSMIIVLIAAIM